MNYSTRMLKIFTISIFYHKIDQSQDYLMKAISQECWQDCNHKIDRNTRIKALNYSTRMLKICTINIFYHKFDKSQDYLM